MDNKKIGDFISEIRKSKNMTQKELAEKLNITDKAISKWERGIGYPEITMIPLLAKTLDVSINELMLGERVDSAQVQERRERSEDPDVVFLGTAQYVEESYKQRVSKANGNILAILSITFLVAIFVCMLCNYVIDKAFTWSLYVVGSELTAWLVIAPLFILKRNRFTGSMIGLTISIFPLLFLIEYLCPAKGWVIEFAGPIVLASLVSLWISVALLAYTKINRFYLVSFLLLLYGIGLNIGCNAFISNYLVLKGDNISVLVTAISCGLAAAVLSLITFTRQTIVKY